MAGRSSGPGSGPREIGAQPWRVTDDGLIVSVRLTPKGGRDAIDGVEQLSDGAPVLKARVRAAPQDGEANAALAKLLTQVLGVPASRVRLIAGASARIKTIKVEGDGRSLAAILEKFGGKAA